MISLITHKNILTVLMDKADFGAVMACDGQWHKVARQVTRLLATAVGFFSLPLTRRGSGGEEVGSRSNTSGEVGSRFPSTFFFSSVRGQSKHSWVAGGQRDNRSGLVKTTVGSSVSENTSKDHAHGGATHAMTDDANWCGVGMRTSPVRLQRGFP